MRRDEYTACVEVACDAFLTNNPAVVKLGIPREAWKAYTLADIPPELAVDTGLSLVARADDGSVLAFLFLVVADLSHTPPKEVWDMHPGLRSLKEGVSQVYEKAVMNGLKLGSLTSGRTLRCAMGGTMPAVNGQGAGKALRLRAVEVARERCFNTLLVEPGHGATRHIWTVHCGGVIRAEVPLDDFVDKRGQKPVAGVEGSLSVCEVVLQRSVRDAAMLWPLMLARLALTAAS